jgi:predicted negative regulator of RcsB-dependent stress response
MGNPDAEITSYQGLGHAMLLVGRTEDAERYFRLGVEGLDRLGETGFNSTMTALLADALCDLGRWDEAEAFVERSREMGPPDDFATQAQWRMALARIHIVRERPEEALSLADEAVGFVEPTDYLTMRAEAHQTRGDVLVALGRVEEARSAFEAAVRLFESKGSVPQVERARLRLAELGA